MTDLITITNLPDLNALVAERVLGIEVFYAERSYAYYFAKSLGQNPLSKELRKKDNSNDDWVLPRYSENIAAAWEIAENLRMQLKPRGGDGWWASVSSVNWIEADTAPLAICLAALRSVGVEVDLKLGGD